MAAAADAWVWSPGVVVRGHRVASGTGADRRFPEGTIRPQLPFLAARVPGFADWLPQPHPATINVRLAGAVRLGRAEAETGPIRWTALFPPENFLLSRCLLDHRGVQTRAFLYVPDPATKPDHLQAPDIMEVLAPNLPGLAYGDAVRIGRAPGVFDVLQQAETR